MTREEELAAREPSAARRIISERFSVGPFDVPNDSYHTDEEGALFFHPNALARKIQSRRFDPRWSVLCEMESLCARLHRVLALAMGAPADFFEDKIDKHCSNLQVANYPSLDPLRWRDSDRIRQRWKKSHADSGTLTVLWRSPPTEGTKGGLQVLDDTAGTWVDVPVLPGGNERESGALLINLGEPDAALDRRKVGLHEAQGHQPGRARAGVRPVQTFERGVLPQGQLRRRDRSPRLCARSREGRTVGRVSAGEVRGRVEGGRAPAAGPGAWTRGGVDAVPR